jgi:Family of unknown function (DUF6445)
VTSTNTIYTPGQAVRFAGADATIIETDRCGGEDGYLIASGNVQLPMWIPAAVLDNHQKGSAGHKDVYGRTIPHIVIVDNFFDYPDEIRAIGLAQEYIEDLRFYKGVRSTLRFLWPHLREEFSRLLGVPIIRWLELDTNGCFQQTSHTDPLVYHHDEQSYAAAIYLTPDATDDSGTSFWRDRKYRCRRRPDHPFERKRLGREHLIDEAKAVVYDQYNLTHPDNWELVESVAGLYNRLVLWDASLIHSATSYDHFSAVGVAPTRLVQLFFFDI